MACWGTPSLRLRAIALALRALRLRAIALALRALRLRAIALALRALRLRAIALALRALLDATASCSTLEDLPAVRSDEFDTQTNGSATCPGIDVCGHFLADMQRIVAISLHR